MTQRLSFVFIGLSITSSWGNGHATTYRSLLRELAARGHSVTFIEQDVPWYAANRDQPSMKGCRIILHSGLDELRRKFADVVADADVVIVGSYVPDAVRIAHWVFRTASGLVAFYDVDTPVTLAKLERGDYEYLTPELIQRYHLYLSFTGGPTLQLLERQYGSPRAVPLYCSVDPSLYYPEIAPDRWDLGYMGTYSADRQPPLETLLLEPARTWKSGRFVVAGPQYPADVRWPANVERIEHLAPARHRRFYNEQRFTLNITRADMIRAGFSPSVRLFEAAACGAVIISDVWDGIDEFFRPDDEIFLARSTADVLAYLRETTESERGRVARSARARVLRHHTAAHRARELEGYAAEMLRPQAVR